MCSQNWELQQFVYISTVVSSTLNRWRYLLPKLVMEQLVYDTKHNFLYLYILGKYSVFLEY